MSFSGTVWSIVVGNAILALVAVMVGIIGAKSGKTTLVLARNFLGKRSSAIMSVLIALSAVNWIAVNADTFANMILTNFKWWPLPVWLTAIIVVAIWAQSAIRGVRSGDRQLARRSRRRHSGHRVLHCHRHEDRLRRGYPLCPR